MCTSWSCLSFMKRQDIIYVFFSLLHFDEGFYSFVCFSIRCKSWNFSAITECN